jgi:hypothetical protein
MPRKLAGAIAALGLILATAISPAEAIVVEKDATTPVSAKHWTASTVSTISTGLGSTYRLVDLEVVTASPLTLAATAVANSGTYASSWHWYVGKTLAEVQDLPTYKDKSERIIDVESYMVDGVRKYAVIMVNNTGSTAKAWKWYVNASPSTISSKLSGYRLTHISLTGGSTTNYDVIMIANSGGDATSWWYYYKQTTSSVTTKLNDNKARLIDVEPDGDGTFTVIMAASPSAKWWWFVNMAAGDLQTQAQKYLARIATVKVYTVSGVTKYAAIYLNNSSGESARLRDIMLSGSKLGGTFGIYLKKVGGSTIVNYQGSTQFEPASSIKVLHHLYTMQQIQSGNIGNGSLLSFYSDPSTSTDGPGVCPDPAWETTANHVTLTMKTSLYGLLQDSDNRITRGFELRWGRSNLNSKATSIGMSKTLLGQIVGCGNDDGLVNATTMADLGKIYEGVSNGSLLTGGNRTQFWTLLLGGRPSSGIKAIVDSEASKLGKSASVASAFYNEMEIRSKGGSYDMCFPTGSCPSPYMYVRTHAGRMTIPFKSSGRLVPTDYVFGEFVDQMSINCGWQGTKSAATYGSECPAWANANTAIGTAFNELFRSQINAALKTW